MLRLHGALQSGVVVKLLQGDCKFRKRFSVGESKISLLVLYSSSR